MSEWKQQFSPPNQTRDCIHRSLASSCIICELEKEVFEADKTIDELKSQLKEANEKLDWLGTNVGRLVWSINKASWWDCETRELLKGNYRAAISAAMNKQQVTPESKE